jgi:hypothetical protein
MSTTQLRGSQILDGTITSADIDDALEKNFTKVRVTTDDSSSDFLSSKLAAGSGITLAVVGASGSSQTLRIAATGGGAGGSSLTISGSSGATSYSDVPATVVFDNDTGFQVEDLGSGTAKITIASHFKNIFVSGSDTLIATGSDSVQVMGDGGVQVSSYVDQEGYDLGLTLAPKVLLITAVAMSQSFASRIDNINNTIVPASYVISGTSYGQTTWVGSSNAYARADHQHGTPPAELSSGFFGALFGDASDGNVTITGLTTLTREMHYNNLTITSTGELKPNGNRIFVAGTLTIDSGGSINDDGFSATNHVGRTGFAARNYLGGQGTSGGAGWSLNTTNVANGNNASNNTNCSLNSGNSAPAGGKGGDSTSRTGGNGGTATQNAVPQKWAGRILEGRGTFGAFNGGAGGGGGSISVSAYTSGTFISGGGGSGGGIVWIAAKTIINNGRISASGGDGANASLGVGSGGCAGGGGGGGGDVGIITQSLTLGGTVDITGGTGGLGAATAGHIGQNGTPGAAGSYTLLEVK